MTEENTTTEQQTTETVGETEETLATQEESTLAEGAEETTEGSTEETTTEKTTEEEETTEENKGTKKKEETSTEKYDLKLPEGMDIDQTLLDAITPIFQALDLSTEDTQKIVDAYIPIVQAQSQKDQDSALKLYKDTVEGWKKDTMKELGADSKSKLAFVAKARNKFGDESFQTMLKETGVGNHPALVRFLIGVGKSVSENVDVSASGSGPADPLKKMYPTMDKKR